MADTQTAETARQIAGRIIYTIFGAQDIQKNRCWGILQDEIESAITQARTEALKQAAEKISALLRPVSSAESHSTIEWTAIDSYNKGAHEALEIVQSLITPEEK